MKKRTLQEKDKQYLWHPYTQMHDYEDRDLLLIDHAQGLYLYDEQGKQYMDTISSWWCILHGHNHPIIKAAVKGQLDKLEQVLLAGTSHEPAITVAEKLVQITPENLTRVFYSDNGSTACEIAIKMSLQYWQHSGQPERHEFVALERGYHGDTIGTMSLGGTPGFHGPFERLTFDSHRVPSPYCYRCPMAATRENCALECLTPLETLLKERGPHIAAMIIEPLIQAAGGMIIYPAKYLTRTAALCKKHGVHLVLDEVATGFGRTGTMFAMEQAGISCDFLCLSKGLTAGYLPMAATMTSEEIFQAFYGPYQENKTFFHGHTFTGNPLGCAAALGSLQVFEEETVLATLPKKIAHLHQKMDSFQELPHIGDIRKLGMICALELVKDKHSKEPFAIEERMGWKIYLESLKHGIILRPMGNVTYLWLPLSTTIDEIDAIVERTMQVMQKIGKM